MQKKIRVAFFPYGQLQENPYQNLIIKGLEACDVEIIKIPGRKFFPLLQILKAKPDVLHFFWPHDLYIGKNKLTAAFKRFTLALTLPIIKTTNSVYSADNLISHETENISVITEAKWINRILHQCKGIVFMSKAAQKEYIKFYSHVPNRQLIIPHVNYKSIYKNDMDMETCRKSLGLATESIFCIIGRIQPYKGIVEIIEAFKSLQNNQATLLICGQCSSEDYLQKIIKACGTTYQQNIKIFNEYIPNEAIQLYINASDYLILNYIDKPINPGTAILAKTFNKSVIAKADNVIQEVLGFDGNYYFDNGETNSILNTMRRAIEGNEDKTPKAVINNEADEPIQIGKQLKEFYQSLLTNTEA